MSYKIKNKELIFTLHSLYNYIPLIILLMLVIFILLPLGQAVPQFDFSAPYNPDSFITNGNSLSLNSFNFPYTRTLKDKWATYVINDFSSLAISYNAYNWASNNIWEPFNSSITLYQQVQQPLSNTPFVTFDLSPQSNQWWNDPIYKYNQWVSKGNFKPFGQLEQQRKSTIPWKDPNKIGYIMY